VKRTVRLASRERPPTKANAESAARGTGAPEWPESDWKWLEDIQEAEAAGHLASPIAKIHLAPLIERLRSEVPSKRACEWLADLLERRLLRRPAGGQANPIWDPPDAEVTVRWAEWEYYRLRRAGLNHDAALKQAASPFQLTAKILQTSLDGRRGSSRRYDKRGSGRR